MDEAIRLLGSFARYVDSQEPELSPRLMRLAMAWAAQQNLPLGELAKAMAAQAAEQDRSGTCTP